MISASTESFENEDAKIAAFVNGEPLAFERYWVEKTNFPEEITWKYRFVRLKGSGFDENHITLYNVGAQGIFDNLKIQGTVSNMATYHWTDDSNSRIDSTYNYDYTHKVNLQDIADATINGVTFTGAGTGNSFYVTNGSQCVVGPDWEVRAAGNELLQIDYEWDDPQPGDFTTVTGDGKGLLEHIMFNQSGSIQFRLDVTPYSSNVFVLHNFGWFPEGAFEFYVSANDGGPPNSVDMSMYGQSNGCIVEYEYKAPADGEFIFTLTRGAHPVYAFSNYETMVPEGGIVISILFSVFSIFIFRKAKKM